MTPTPAHAASALSAALALSACLVAAEASQASAVRAFVRSDDFSAPAETGGGGRRRFTGAPGDGLTCAVCHRAGRSRPTLSVTGMPDVFVPGASYDVVLEWPESPDNAALGFELATADGHGAGMVTLFDDAALEARDRCAGGATAAHLVSDLGDRQVVTLDSCGASRLRVHWTAPTSPGAVWIDAVLVQGNGSGDPSGDASIEHARLVPAEGFGTDAVVLGGGCSVRSPIRDGSAAWLVAAAAAAVAFARRGRRRARHGR